MFALALGLSSCDSDDDGTISPEPQASDYKDLLINQIDQVIIPTMELYQADIVGFSNKVSAVTSPIDESGLMSIRSAYRNAYISYQSAALHNYFSTSSTALVARSNLFPIDLSVLENLIQTESRNFNSTDHQRANGFPVLDYMLYGPANVVDYFNGDEKRLSFMKALINNMAERADNLVTQWKNLRENFIDAGGTGLGSAISGQLNGSLVYYEDHIRENKVGIPIGRLGPNDSPIAADPSKIEAYYQSQFDGNESFTLELLKASIEEMQDLYLGENTSGIDGKGYDDLLVTRNHSLVDDQIKTQFREVLDKINSRTSISGNDELYLSVQEIVTSFKSDLLPILNVQDADGANDGD